jgi:myosin heavy subunit
LNHSSITIQRFARGKLGRRRIYHIRKKLAAVTSIQATARKAAATKTYHPQLRWLRRLKVPTSILQSQVRLLKSIVLATKLREAVVFDNEKILRAHKSLCYCRQIVRTELCIESYRGRAKYRGEFQAIFAKYCRTISTSKQSFKTHSCIKLLGVHPAVELTSSKRQMQPRAISQDITVRGRTLTEDNNQLVQQAHCYGAKMSASEFTRLFKDTSGAVVGFSRPSAKERSYNGIKTRDLEVIFAREKRHGEKCITFDIFLALSIV